MLKIFLLLLLMPSFVFAASWSGHEKNIRDLERDIFKHEQEMETLVERKKKTRDSARVEETLQRIVEIHAELISLRKGMDLERAHLQKDHPDKAHILDSFDSRSIKAKKSQKKYRGSHLSSQLDQLLIKVRMKFSTFITSEEPNKEMSEVEKVVEKKRKKKREREADVYLRRRSKIKMTK